MKHEVNCIQCKSNNVTKQGFRKNTFSDVQKYYCKRCNRVFSINSNYRMRYPKKIRELALKLNKEGKTLRQISKQINKKTHVSVSPTAVMRWIKKRNKDYNYRYANKCNICLRFIPANGNHTCEKKPCKKDGLYHCAKCDKYLLKKYFNKDHTKKYGIMSCCKKCRKPTLDRQNKIKGIIARMKRINKHKI